MNALPTERENRNLRSTELCAVGICRRRRVPRRLHVAQILDLLYRGIAFCGPRESYQAAATLDGQPISNRRYSSLKVCATSAARLAASFVQEDSIHGQAPATH